MHFKNEDDYKKWAETQEDDALGGGLFTPDGPENYVGAVSAIRAVLYFKEGYSDEMREAIALCFDDYQKIAQDHLTWLWQDEPPSASDKTMEYTKAKPIRKILSNYSRMKAFGLLYISGKETFATGPWEFYVNGKSEWQAKKGTRQSTLTFSMPISWVEENSKIFIDLFIKCANRINANHGYAGYACVISHIRSDKNEPTEAFLSRKMWALDVGNPVLDSSYLIDGIKTVSWLTAINYDWFNKIKEEEALNSELPLNWFIGYDYGNGVVIQAGCLPNAGIIDEDPLPAPYVLLNRILKPLRVKKIGSLHRGNYDSESNPLVTGYRAEAWMKRFDIEDDRKLEFFEKLQAEPKLSSAFAFPEKRINWN